MTDLNAFLPYVNGPLGFLFRRALWIPDRRYRIARIDPNAHHLDLGDGRYRAVMYTCDHHMQAAYKKLDWFMRSSHRWDNLVGRLAPAFDLGFATYSEQPDETGSTDTRMTQESPSSNFETDTSLIIGENYGATQLVRTLIKFDFSELPPLYIPDPGTLSLRHYSAVALNARTARMFRQKRAWVESQATWNVYSTGNNWQTSGGFGVNDCEQSAVASRSFSASESAGEKTWSIDAKSLEDMCNGVFTNNGWLMKMDTEDNDQQRFRSSSYTAASERPKLTFEYYPQDDGGLLL